MIVAVPTSELRVVEDQKGSTDAGEHGLAHTVCHGEMSDARAYTCVHGKRSREFLGLPSQIARALELPKEIDAPKAIDERSSQRRQLEYVRARARARSTARSASGRRSASTYTSPMRAHSQGVIVSSVCARRSSSRIAPPRSEFGSRVPKLPQDARSRSARTAVS